MGANFNATPSTGGAMLGGNQPTQQNPYSYNAQDPWASSAAQGAYGNLQGAQIATQANRVNQNTPYGSLNYSQSTDANGNPTWTANQTINPQLGGAINSNFGQLNANYSQPFKAPTFSTGGDLASMGYYGSKLNAQQLDPNSLKALPQYDVNTQINQGALPSYGIDPGQSYTDAIMQRLQPSLARQSASSDVQLANQGIMPGSEAYNTAKTLLSQQQNDARTSAITGGMGVGLQANQQAYGQQAGQIGLNLQGQGQNFNQGIAGNQQYIGANSQAYNQQLANQQLALQAQNQSFNQAQAEYGMPLNVANQLKNISAPGYVNPYSQAATAGPDYLGAAGLSNQNAIANQNMANAGRANLQSGLFNLAGAGILGYALS